MLCWWYRMLCSGRQWCKSCSIPGSYPTTRCQDPISHLSRKPVSTTQPVDRLVLLVVLKPLLLVSCIHCYLVKLKMEILLNIATTSTRLEVVVVMISMLRMDNQPALLCGSAWIFHCCILCRSLPKCCSADHRPRSMT